MANTHRAFALLAIRNILRACFSLAVLYTTRWQYSTKKFFEVTTYRLISVVCRRANPSKSRPIIRTLQLMRC